MVYNCHRHDSHCVLGRARLSARRLWTKTGAGISLLRPPADQNAIDETPAVRETKQEPNQDVKLRAERGDHACQRPERWVQELRCTGIVIVRLSADRGAKLWSRSARALRSSCAAGHLLSARRLSRGLSRFPGRWESAAPPLARHIAARTSAGARPTNSITHAERDQESCQSLAWQGE